MVLRVAEIAHEPDGYVKLVSDDPPFPVEATFLCRGCFHGAEGGHVELQEHRTPAPEKLRVDHLLIPLRMAMTGNATEWEVGDLVAGWVNTETKVCAFDLLLWPD